MKKGTIVDFPDYDYGHVASAEEKEARLAELRAEAASRGADYDAEILELLRGGALSKGLKKGDTDARF